MTMAAKPKIFISYATEDRPTAERLYADLRQAGAEVFEFERSAKSGTSAWTGIYESIDSSDVFIMLVSRNSLKSFPVKQEVEHAHYTYVNTEGAQPSRLIPAFLEEGVRPPNLLETFTGLPLYNYTISVKELITQLGLAAPLPPPPINVVHDAPRSSTKTASKDRLTFSTPSRTTFSGLSGSQLNTSRVRPLYSSRLTLDNTPDFSSRYPSLKLGTPLPGAEKASYTSHWGRYLSVTGIVAVLGAIVGLLAGSFLRSSTHNLLMPITSVIRQWSENLIWLPLVSAILICLILARAAWARCNDDLPYDSFEYALVSAKSLVVALLLAFIWITLFSLTVSTEVSSLFVLACDFTTMGTIAVYIILNEW